VPLQRAGHGRVDGRTVGDVERDGIDEARVGGDQVVECRGPANGRHDGVTGLDGASVIARPKPLLAPVTNQI